MLRSSYRRMLDRGRKAGVNAHEMYRALGSRQPAPGDEPVGRADCNGYVAEVQENGHRAYQQPPEK
jgi:hypothetical protein